MKIVILFLYSLVFSISAQAVEFNYDFESLCAQTKQVDETPDSGIPLDFALGAKADFILVVKSKRQLSLFQAGKKIKTYRMALGRSPVGKKRQVGDNKTPEGLYQIQYKNSASDYHLSLAISYPNQDDIDWARKNGVSPGGDIMIHGLPNSAFKRAFINHPESDWTRGCVAVNNEEIEEIWEYVSSKTPIEICP